MGGAVMDASEKAVDFAYLEGFMAGNQALVDEVLAIFSQQAAIWASNLDPANPGWRDLAHTIKGAAHGVGANLLGQAAALAEVGTEADLTPVKEALAITLAAIEAYSAARS